MNARGCYLITWNGPGPGSRYDSIWARRFGSHGEPIGETFRLNEYLKDWQAAPVVAFDGQGNAIFAWQSLFEDGDGWGIFGRRFTGAVDKDPN